MGIRTKWTNYMLQLEALKHKTRNRFQKDSPNAYAASFRRGRDFIDKICSHMPPSEKEAWLDSELHIEALKFNKRTQFSKGNPGAYITALNRGKGFLDKICLHMQESETGAYTDEELRIKALKYLNRKDFKKKDGGAHRAACKRGIVFLDSICLHMVSTKSRPENDIRDAVRCFFSDAGKIRIKNFNLPDRPYIKEFEGDVFVPSLMKVVEFDGTYYHSFKKMRTNKNKKLWSDDDVLNYHSLKDWAFALKGFEVLHIKEVDWDNNRSYCISQIEQFLGITGFMSEPEQRVA